MRYLIDTQALIWFAEANPRLSAYAKGLIKNPENEIFVSQFSYVEVAIKMAVNKMDLENGLSELMKSSQAENIETLLVQTQHILAYNQIPLHENHRDPFDRMILATALVENLPVITSDEKFRWYPELIQVVW